MWYFRRSTETGLGWTPSRNFCCQSSHLTGGAFAVFACLAKGFPWWSIAILVILAALKEFVLDLGWLEDDTPGWPGSTEDFTFYLAGGLIGYLAFAFVP